MLLLIIDLLHGLAQVGLQLVVCVCRLLRQITFDGQSFSDSAQSVIPRFRGSRVIFRDTR